MRSSRRKNPLITTKAKSKFQADGGGLSPSSAFSSYTEIFAVYNFIYVFTTLVNVVLSVLQLLLVARAILSWLPTDGESRLVGFITMLTEPVVLPVRLLLEKSDTLAGLPVDVSCLTTYMILSTVQIMLPTVNL